MNTLKKTAVILIFLFCLLGNGFVVGASGGSDYTNSTSVAANFSNNGINQNVTEYTNNSLPKNENDDLLSRDQTTNKAFIAFDLLAAVFLFMELALLCYLGYGIVTGVRKLRRISWRNALSLLILLLLYIPIFAAIYRIPSWLGNGSWEKTYAQMPQSFSISMILSISLCVVTFLVFLVTFLFPNAKKFIDDLPLTIIVSLVAGLSNSAIVLLITNANQLSNNPILGCLIFGYVFVVFVLSNKYSKSRLIQMTNHAIYDLRLQLIEKLSATSYQNYESLDKGQIYATLNGDTEIIGSTSVMTVTLIINIIEVICIFIYLAIISFWFTLVMFGLATLIAVVYYFISNKAEESLEEARTSQNDYLRLISGLMEGFKEICMHRRKKNEYKNELEDSCAVYRDKSDTGSIKFINAAVFGDSTFIVLLGVVAFFIPTLLPDMIKQTMILQLTMVFIYLIGPVNEIMNIIPMVTKIKISWKRIKDFIQDIPVSPAALEQQTNISSVESFALENVMFEYLGEGTENFTVGPVNFRLTQGQILFIIGGNGSGKTTLAKLITGLYQPQNGKIKVNDREISGVELSEHFSAVFSDFHLFKKIYNVDLQAKQESIDKYLKILQLDKKVTIENNSFSTIDLSGGQRKRLALLKCYIEDNPIYLFDEWAADQDPHFRRFFYRELLPQMKQEGKIIIAITHDDHYFDVADQVIKLDFGKMEDYDALANEFASRNR